MKKIIWKSFEFEAAHHLPNHQGFCQRCHGHSYKLQIGVTGELQATGPAGGMIMDFGDLKRAVKERVIDLLDHTNLNDRFENPTAEKLGDWIWKQLEQPIPGLYGVRVWETSGSYYERIDG